jgi:hypothetical protein
MKVQKWILEDSQVLTFTDFCYFGSEGYLTVLGSGAVTLQLTS